MIGGNKAVSIPEKPQSPKEMTEECESSWHLWLCPDMKFRRSSSVVGIRTAEKNPGNVNQLHAL